jgi:hypothetical protein
MMVLALRKLADAVDERERLGEVAELKFALQGIVNEAVTRGGLHRG